MGVATSAYGIDFDLEHSTQQVCSNARQHRTSGRRTVGHLSRVATSQPHTVVNFIHVPLISGNSYLRAVPFRCC